MRQVNEQLVLDIRSAASPVQGGWMSPDSDEERGPDPDLFQRRPLLSHGLSSRRSSSSSSSTTTHGPASTIDPRISISSTIYPASSAHSHPHDMYHSTDPVPIVPPYRSSSLHHGPELVPRHNDRESFIDIVSPAAPVFTLPELHHHRNHSQPPSRTSSPKPPVPTAPKPMFKRSSPKSSPQQRFNEPKQNLPPTTNFLDLDERSDLIRKNRKLAQVFGQPPGPDVFPQLDASRFNDGPPVLPPISSGNNRHQRAALSASGSADLAVGQQGPWIAALEYMNMHGRRHSTPLSPDNLSFLRLRDDSTKPSRSAESDIHAQDINRSSSPTSFIDLSDDHATKAAPQARGRRPSSPSAQSLYENMSPEEQLEEARRRKREKLAKLHRFLGSRVPTNLVLGLDESELALPPINSTTMAMLAVPENEEATRKAWLRRRRSSSAAAYSSTWSDEVDRIKEDLNLREKAINVRRAQKMEKVIAPYSSW